MSRSSFRVTHVVANAVSCLSICCLFSGILQAQSDLAEEAVALEEGWDAEQDVLDKITELGGWYKIEACLSDEMKDMVDADKQKFVVEVNMVYTEDGGRQDNDNLSPDALQLIAQCTQVKRVMLKDSQANDEQLKHLANLTKIEQLLIWDATDVTDAGLKHLSKLDRLKKIHVSNSAITDAGIGHLTELPELEGLSLQGNSFTNKIFEHASKLENLKSLVVGLGENDITDEGLKHLQSCDKLERLGIQQSGISSDAVDQLKEKLPTLTTVWNN